jgi:hypothetical protein
MYSTGPACGHGPPGGHHLDPLVDIRGIEAGSVWGTDPVHPQPAVYGKIAAAVAKLGDKIKLEEAEAKRSRDSMGDQSQSGPNARRGRGGPPSDDGEATEASQEDTSLSSSAKCK